MLRCDFKNNMLVGMFKYFTNKSYSEGIEVGYKEIQTAVTMYDSIQSDPLYFDE